MAKMMTDARLAEITDSGTGVICSELLSHIEAQAERWGVAQALWNKIAPHIILPIKIGKWERCGICSKGLAHCACKRHEMNALMSDDGAAYEARMAKWRKAVEAVDSD